MGRKNKYSFSIAAVLISVLIFVLPLVQMLAPAVGTADIRESNFSDEKPPMSSDTVIARQTSLARSSDGAIEISDTSAVTVEDGIKDTSAVAPEDVLPGAESGVTDNSSYQTVREGVSVAPVEVNSIIRDSLKSIISSKVYTFSVDSRGIIVYAFNHTESADINGEWYITLYEEYSPDGSGRQIAYRELNRLEYTSVGDAAQSVSIGVLPGNYRLSVECVSGFTDIKYDLAIGFRETDGYEVEYNDTETRYTVLSPGKTLSGSASSYSDGRVDEDWYMFEVTGAGYAVLYFEHEADTNETAQSVAWKITVVDSDGNEYFSADSVMDNTAINSGIMGLSPGYYFVCVSSHVHSGVTYSLNVSFNQDSAVESELNDSPETAAEIPINTEIAGALTKRDGAADRDYFTFNMENDGFIALAFVHEALSEQHSGWNITILSESGQTVYSAVSDWSQYLLQSPNIGVPAGRYYIRIDSDNLYLSSIVYRLILVTVADGSWETEPNNTASQADNLTLGQTVNGTLIETGTSYDEDYFSFTVSEACAITVSFGHIVSADSREGWLVSLLDGDGTVKASLKSNWNDAQKTFTADIEPGTYYILIETGLYFNSAQYELTVTA